MGFGADLFGNWLIQSWTENSSGGGLTTFAANTTPPSIRGGLSFEPAASDLSFTVMFGFLEDGAPTDLPSSNTMSAVVEDADHVLLDDVVFNYAVDGDELTLTLDEMDSRNVDVDASTPTKVVAQRLVAANYPIIGTWDLTSWTPSGGSAVSPDDCMAMEGGGGYEKFTMDLVVDDLLVLTLTSTSREFSDDACTMETGSGSETNLGFADQEADALRLWMVNAGDPTSSGMYLEFTTTGTTTLDMTRTGCLPIPDCTGEGPQALVWQRR